MIRSIIVENLRCWAGRHEIPLAPLTFIYGPNSSGKSTLFHALDLLRQSLEQATGTSASLVCGGPHIDAGDFVNLIWQHEIYETAKSHKGIPRPLCRLSLGFSFDAPEMAVSPPFLLPSSYRRIVATFEYADDRASLGELRRLDFQIGDISFGFGITGDGWRLVAVTDAELAPPNYAFETENIHELPTRIHDVLYEDATKDLIKPIPGEDAVAWVLSQFCDGAQFQLRRGFPSYASWIQPSLPKDTTEPIENQGIKEPSGVNGAAGRVADAWFRHIGRFADEVFTVLDRLRHIGPLRRPPERVQLTTKLTDRVDDVGSIGENIIPVLEKHVVQVRKALRCLEPGGWYYDAAVGSAKLGSDGIIGKVKFLKIRDVRRNGWDISPTSKKFDNDTVGLPDVGFGISQLLPIVVQVAAGTGLVCVVEQPEIHLHPRLQSELGDMFVSSVLGESRHQLVVETHSEHLILRILRRIRETSEGSDLEGCPPIKPDHAIVLYVEPKKDGTEVVAISMTEAGEFSQRWPGGFFIERIRELM